MQMDYLDFKALLEELGITDKKFIGPLYSQLTNVDGFGGDGVEFAASVIKSVAPNDPLSGADGRHALGYDAIHAAGRG